MTNRIREIRVTHPRWDPAEVEVWITVVPERVTATTEIRGRLMGPRCFFSTTVEVAYHLRPMLPPPQNAETITVRAVIPEANLWEPQCPFYYEGPLELWDAGQCCDRIQIRHGLRLLQFGRQGLRLNGHPFSIRGDSRNTLSEEAALQLRQGGANTLLCPISKTAGESWDIADRMGIFMLGGDLGRPEQFQQALDLSWHPSCLGWLLSPEQMEHVVEKKPDWPGLAGERAVLLGVELSQLPDRPMPEWVNVVACRKPALANLGSLPLPKIILGQSSPGKGIESGEVTISGAILGWIS